MKITNMDTARRAEILGIPDGPYSGGTLSFADAGADDLRTLLKEGFADPEDQQNDAPTFEEIVEFLEKNPSFTGHGYVVSPERDDYRVTLEGVESSHAPTQDEIHEFVKMFRFADEFEHGSHCYAWYD